jgi:hypothetical protein
MTAAAQVTVRAVVWNKARELWHEFLVGLARAAQA